VARYVRSTSTPAGRITQISLKTSLEAVAMSSAAAVNAAKLSLTTSYGEDRRRKADDFRQFSEVLGGGGQHELVPGSARSAEAQSTQPGDALQMSE
jgi:hypothetical protein